MVVVVVRWWGLVAVVAVVAMRVMVGATTTTRLVHQRFEMATWGGRVVQRMQPTTTAVGRC